VPATCPYPEPDRSSPCPPPPLPEDTSKFFPPIYAWVYMENFRNILMLQQVVYIAATVL
jgi:hypothetical protein